jgi:CRISPR-associated endoribonuclease Cas6
MLPVNYQYALSSWIYKVIERSDLAYSEFLHNQGFRYDGRRFKMFTFSQLDVRPYQMANGQIRLLGTDVSLAVRFAVDSSLENFIKGLFKEQRFSLGDRYSATDFEVSRVDTIAAPAFTPTMTYRCLSPICISRTRENRSAEYLSPEAQGYGPLLVQNLVRKSSALVHANESTPVEYPQFRFRLLNTPRKKGIHIKEYEANHTQVIGYLFHFELTAPVELHETGYYAGFGEKNSMGFGCVEKME